MQFRLSGLRKVKAMSLEYVLSMSGFYLGYSRGRSFPPRKKILLSLQYIVTISEKSSRRDEVSAQEVNVSIGHYMKRKTLSIVTLSERDHD